MRIPRGDLRVFLRQRGLCLVALNGNARHPHKTPFGRWTMTDVFVDYVSTWTTKKKLPNTLIFQIPCEWVFGGLWLLRKPLIKRSKHLFVGCTSTSHITPPTFIPCLQAKSVDWGSEVVLRPVSRRTPRERWREAFHKALTTTGVVQTPRGMFMLLSLPWNCM